MPDEQTTPDPAENDARTESGIMTLLLIDHEQRPWTTDELIREIGRPQDVRDAISNLHGAGLLHQTVDGFIFATRAAIRMDRLDM